ncbi:adenylate kinase family protein [Haloferula sp. A504]|uniref:adenylate kinase family protein n=1 Tax=Haloferula sp. A504 TaxID=3373601 RepID=UPI0031CBFCAA|nr:nucleoside monophosphate kinase [Verrucomicrobiaceae bacterium E54]
MTKAFAVRRPAILILGAPGAGKGTQGKILGAIPRFFHCACGDIFRSMDTRTAIGRRFVEYSSRGELVPDELTVELWKSQVENWAESHLYKPDIDFLVLDGIPRNVRQAEIIADFLQVHQVFHLTCPDRGELARRMRKRALKENRIDDASDTVIAQRIETYDAETRPLLDHYPDEIITVVDAMRPPVEVLGDIIRRIVALPAYQEMGKEVV